MSTMRFRHGAAISWTYLFVGGDDVLEQGLVDLAIVPLLLERDSVNLTGLGLGGDIVGVHLQDAVLASLLLLENLQSLGLVTGSDDTVGYLSRDDLGGGGVDGVRESDKVTEG